MLHAAKKALAHNLFRYKDLRRLTEQADSAPAQRSLLDANEAIRPMNEYRLEGPAVNPTLLTKLRHLRPSGMAEASTRADSSWGSGAGGTFRAAAAGASGPALHARSAVPGE